MKKVCVGILFLGLSMMSLGQERFTHRETGLSFVLPAGWSYLYVGDHFEASSPDESVILMFFVSPTSEAAAGMEAIGAELDKIMTTSRMTTKVTEAKVNGLTHLYAEGDGLIEGEPIDWDFTMVLGAQKTMIIIGLGEIASNQAIITNIYASIQR